jgi:imidazole glycerol-phosphate synthase subunit HisH
VNKILVIDYNTGNVDSVVKALKLYENDVVFSFEKKDLDSARKIILPGQGSYDQAIDELQKKNLYEEIIKKSTQENIPIMGICLGMQILSSYGYENNKKTKGLNIIPGHVKKMDENPYPLPNVGWSEVKIDKQDIIFDEIDNNQDFYFIHSYKFVPDDNNCILSTSKYNSEFVSMLKKEKNYGIQFHPEKSLKKGLKILQNFLKIK